MKTGIILAGGKSSRMGRDKGLMLLNNKPMIEYVAESLSTIVDKTMVVTDNKDYDNFEFTRINDVYKNCGPLSGLYSGLKASKTDINFVVSCDVPLITPDFWLQLYGNIKKNIDVVLCANQEYIMPLVAIYKKSKCLNVIQTLLEKGERRMLSLREKVSSKVVYLNEEYNVQMLNINSLNDFNGLKNKMLL